MSIKPYFAVFNNRWNHLERCAEEAPEGTFERAKQAHAAVADASNAIMKAMRDRGFVALNDDRLREVEAVVYNYLLAGNPINELTSAEGFGEAMDGPEAERVKERLISDRDTLATMRP